MADIDQISKITQAISAASAASSGSGVISQIGADSVQGALNSLTGERGSVTDSIRTQDLQKVLDVQAVSSSVLGSSLDLGSIRKAADCFKNIDDILIEKVTQKAAQILLNAAKVAGAAAAAGPLGGPIAALSSAASTVAQIAATVTRLIEVIKSFKNMSLLDLVVLAANSGVLEQVEIFKQIQSQYGEVVGDINEFASKIAGLDICSMSNYKPGYGAIPPAAKIVQTPPAAYPVFAPPVNVNYPALEAKRANDDVMFRLRDAIGDKNGLQNTAPNLSMLNELQIICRSAVNRLSESDVELHSGILTDVTAEIARRRASYASTWGAATLAEYDARASAMLGILKQDGKTIREYALLKSSGQNVPGQLISSGVTIYGGPDWDWTTFLDIKPEQRPADLAAYWASRGYTVSKGEAQLRAAGARPGTLDLSEAYTGAYGARLQPGVSCASTRVPGGSVLQLKNPDGSVYDPAGINPSGLVTVHDTGNSELTYKKVDLFIAREHVDAYKASNMANVQVYLVSLGTKKGKNYEIAKAKYG